MKVYKILWLSHQTAARQNFHTVIQYGTRMINHAKPTRSMGKHYRDEGIGIGTVNIASPCKCARITLLHFSATGLFITQYHSLQIFFSSLRLKLYKKGVTTATTFSVNFYNC